MIDNSIWDYNNQRFKTSDQFIFIFSDNNASSEDLTVFYSINGGELQTLEFSYIFSLSYFNDGVYNLTLYVYDFAYNVESVSIIFSVDMTPPSITDFNIEGLVQVLGINYIPANSNVTFIVTDDDNQINSSYSWGGAIYYDFDNSFILSYPDEASTLFINASDSLGNQLELSIDLTIDSIAPSVTLLLLSNNSKINYETELDFYVNDLVINKVKKVEYSWDIFYPATTIVSSYPFGYFQIFLHHLYSDNDSATLYITAEDKVGNSQTYLLNFIVDLSPPVPALYINNTETNEYQKVDQFFYVRGNTSIWYDATENNDLSSFIYYWDNDEDNEIQLIISSPWIFVPSNDGYHNLTIILEDNTEGSYPNTNQIIYYFYVDDIHVEAVNPSNLLDNVQYQLVYEDTFQFIINIFDIYDNTSIPGLYWNQTSLQLSNDLNLLVTNNTINNKTFQFTIYCTNVSTTSLVFEFSAGESAKHVFNVNLSIAKKEGFITILEDSELSVIYENDIIIDINLKNEYDVNQTIKYIYVNGSQVDFQLVGDYIYQFNYSSSLHTTSKGHYTLEILVESEFYFGQTNSSYLLEFEVLPIPIAIEIFVSGYNITYGNTVVISGLLTRNLTGAPISGQDLTFYIYIYYKNNTQGVFALSGYDEFQSFNDNTNSTGFATITFLITSDMDHIAISVEYPGDPIYGSKLIELNEFINAVKPTGLSSTLLYIIIAAAVVLAGIISFVVYKLTRTKPIEKIMEEIEEEEITSKLAAINPGVILNIFDQRKGAVPLVSSHNLAEKYSNRFVIGLDNFLLKIADQAYSSLGFEEQHDRRRIGSIILPREGMVGFIHGIQLPNPVARGGFENLALVVLVNEEHDNALLGNQVYLYDDIDELTQMLIGKKPIKEITNQLLAIRRKATRIVLAALMQEK